VQLKGIKELKKGFNAVGFSQGGQFLRVREQLLQPLWLLK
jgi:hypothetical protein